MHAQGVEPCWKCRWWSAACPRDCILSGRSTKVKGPRGTDGSLPLLERTPQVCCGVLRSGVLRSAIDTEDRAQPVLLDGELLDRLAGADVVTADVGAEVALQAAQHPTHVLADLRRPDAREADPHVVTVEQEATRPSEQHVVGVRLGEIEHVDHLERARGCAGDMTVDGREIDPAVLDASVVDALETDVDAPAGVEQ